MHTRLHAQVPLNACFNYLMVFGAGGVGGWGFRGSPLATLLSTCFQVPALGGCNICVWMYACMHACYMHVTCMHVTCMLHACMLHACMLHACMHVCMYVYKHTDIYTHTYIHTSTCVQVGALGGYCIGYKQQHTIDVCMYVCIHTYPQVAALGGYCIGYKQQHTATWHGWSRAALAPARLRAFLKVAAPMPLALAMDEWTYACMHACMHACTHT